MHTTVSLHFFPLSPSLCLTLEYDFVLMWSTLISPLCWRKCALKASIIIIRGVGARIHSAVAALKKLCLLNMLLCTTFNFLVVPKVYHYC